MQDILKRFEMKDAKATKTLMGMNGNLDLNIEGKFVDQKVYQSMIGDSRRGPIFREIR
jgi:hypothetical protein